MFLRGTPIHLTHSNFKRSARCCKTCRVLQNISRNLSDDEKAAEQELRDAEAYLERLEKSYRAPSFFEAPLRALTNLFGARPSTAASIPASQPGAADTNAQSTATADRTGPHTAPCSK